jgi:hypothetical protein
VSAQPGGFRQTITMPPPSAACPAPAGGDVPPPTGDGCPFYFAVARGSGALDDPLTIEVAAANECYGVEWGDGTLEAIVCDALPFASPTVWGWDTVTINGVSDALSGGTGATVDIAGFVEQFVACADEGGLFLATGFTVTYSGGPRPEQSFPLYVINDGSF